MKTHTPSPWKATKDPLGNSSDYCIGTETGDARIDSVAVCSSCDAALISAAPELLEALIGMLSIHDSVTMGQEREFREKWVPIARAIIKKASQP